MADPKNALDNSVFNYKGKTYSFRHPSIGDTIEINAIKTARSMGSVRLMNSSLDPEIQQSAKDLEKCAVLDVCSSSDKDQTSFFELSPKDRDILDNVWEAYSKFENLFFRDPKES